MGRFESSFLNETLNSRLLNSLSYTHVTASPRVDLFDKEILIGRDCVKNGCISYLVEIAFIVVSKINSILNLEQSSRGKRT